MKEISLRQIIAYSFIMVALIYCSPSTQPVPIVEPIKTEQPIPDEPLNLDSAPAPLMASRTLTAAQLTTKVTDLTSTNTTQDAKISSLTSSVANLTNQLNTANLSDVTRDKQLTSQSLSIAALQTANKSLQDSIALYKQLLDGAIFKSINGVTTIPYFISMRDYLIKTAAVKP